MMENRRIIRLTKEDVKDFVRSAEKCDFDINIGYNRVLVDAKSILGVLSMELSNDLIVEYAKRDAAFENALRRYEVKECVA